MSPASAVRTPVRFHRPAHLAELALLRREHPDAMLHGGGTVLVPQNHRRREAAPVIYLPALAELDGIESGWCGAVATLADVSVHRGVPEGLAQAAGSVGGPAVRNRATVGGNVAAAAPGCVAVALLALDATAELLADDGATRTAPLATVVGCSGTPILSVCWDPTWTVGVGKARAGGGGPVAVTVAVGGPQGAPPAAVAIGAPGFMPCRASTAELAVQGGAVPQAVLRAALEADGLPAVTSLIAAALVGRAMQTRRQDRR